MTRPDPAPDGLLVLDKPAGPTSHDVVSRCRWLCATRKVGHAGTLDPMATGVLLVGVGRATRLLTHLVGADKTYAATVRVGEATTTEDAQGELTEAPGIDAAAHLADDLLLLRAAAGLTGDVQQVPSAVSALKVDGRRAYARVRDGEEVQLEPRPVTVHSLDLLDRRAATGESGAEVLDLDIRVSVSSGTYVRALARDLGLALGSAAHLTALRRERVGGFRLEDAAALDALVAAREGGALPRELPVLPMAEVARRVMPCADVEAEVARRLRNGQQVELATASSTTGEALHRVAAIGPGDDLVGVLQPAGPRWRPVTVFPVA